jgi:hypothetical protein
VKPEIRILMLAGSATDADLVGYALRKGKRTYAAVYVS